MNKFFRKLRYDFMGGNNTGKYFKYAIGEILLVVIGILIALQINNWNEERKSRINEKELYNRIILDLKLDEKRINEYIIYYNYEQEMHNSIYQETQGNYSFDSIVNFSTFRAAKNFELIVEENLTRHINEISENRIREKIVAYFKLENAVRNALRYLWDFKDNQTKPFLSKYGINDTKELFNNRHLNYWELREKNILSYSKLKERYATEEFDQLLFDLGIKTSYALSTLDNLLVANKELQNDLKNELSE